MSIYKFISRIFIKIILVTGCFIFLHLPGYSQQTNYFFNHLNVKDGLSHSIVNALCIDQEGFLWVATYDGLNRFDGSRFMTFKSNRYDKNSLAHNSVHDVCVDKEDNVWILTEGGISRYNKKTGLFDNFHIYNDSTKLPVAQLNGALLCDRQGTIWCGSQNGISEFLPDENRFTNFEFPVNSGSTRALIGKHNMVEDPRESKLWAATNKGIYCFDTKKKIMYHAGNNPGNLAIFNDHVTYPIYITPDEQIIYGDNTISEICFYNKSTNKIECTKKILQQNHFNVITEAATFFMDADNRLWVSTWGYETYILDMESGDVSQLLHDAADLTSPSSTFAWDILQDGEGTLWYGGVNGISYCNNAKNKYKLFQPAKLYPAINFHKRISSVCEDENNLLWFGTFTAGLFSYDFKTNKYQNFLFEQPAKKIEESFNSIYSLLHLKGNLWIGTERGLQKFNTSTHQFTRVTGIPELKGQGENVVRMLKMESDSIIWFNNSYKALYRYNINDGTYQRWDTITVNSTKIPVTYTVFIHIDSKKRVWISPNIKELLCYKPGTDSFRLIKANENDSAAFPQMPINSFVEDDEGNLWAPVKGIGLTKFNPETGKVKLWTSSDGLAWDHCLDLAKDRYGKLWITAYNLVSVFDPSTNQFRNFEIEYANANYAYFNKMITLQNGNIISTVRDAFVMFEPEKHKTQKDLPRVLISHFKVFEEPIRFSQHHPEIKLSHRENYFSIEYSVLTGVDAENIEYQYKLDGFDKDWIQAGTRKYAAYTNVPGGDYIFKVRARRGDSDWTENATLVNINITKVFYQTWWFRVLLALLIFVIIRLYFLYREKQHIRKSEQEAINYFTHSQYTNNSADEILWDLARNVISRLNFEDCVIYIVDKQKKVLVQKAGLDNKMKDDYSISNPIEIPIGKGIVGNVAITGKAEIIGDTSRDSRYIVDDVMRYSEIAVPIIHNEEVIGVIDSEHPKKNFFTKKHLQQLSTIASISADKIANAIARQQLQDKEFKLMEYDKKVAEVRLTALRAQMNPHFIFNCMNAIDNFILKNNPEEASRYLNKFARLIRSILTESDKKLISLKSELEILNNYIELENLRFEEKFDYRIHVSENVMPAEIEIPPMLIQPFVENAILHGLAPKHGKKKLSIDITRSNGTLLFVIEDNGIGRQKSGELNAVKSIIHESKGMRITENRFELLRQQMHEKGSVNVKDLMDDAQHPSGTRIEITIPVETDEEG